MSLADVFTLQNPWRSEQSFDPGKFIERNVLKNIVEWMDDEDVLVLVGPRQMAKPSSLKKLSVGGYFKKTVRIKPD